MVKSLPANEAGVEDAGSIPGSGRSPGGGHGIHSSILAWRIPWTEGPGGLTVHGVAQSCARLKQLSAHVSSTFLGSGH